MSNLANVGDFCPNEGCSDYGKTDAGNIIKHGTTPKGLQRYRCKTCGKTFSERVVLWFKTCVFTGTGFSAPSAAARGPG